MLLGTSTTTCAASQWSTFFVALLVQYYLVAVAFRRRVVKDELVVVSIDGKVGDVNAAVGDLVFLLGVLLGGNPHQTVLVHIQLQRIQARHQHVQPHVKLKIL